MILNPEHVTEDDVISVILYADEPERHTLTTLTETGCVPFRVRASAEGLHIGGVVENWDVLKSIGDALEDEQQQFDLISVKETNSLPRPFDESRTKHVIQDTLTAQQFSLLETAYEAGYFHVPKETTSQELAEQLEMSQSTFSEQLRTAQAELYRHIFGSV